MWLWEEQGGLMGPFSFLLLVLLLTRSPFNACLFTGSLYLLLRLFSFEPVPSRRAMQVLKPRDRVSAIAHRGGSHDAPENTLAAIRQVSPPCLPPLRPSWELGLLPAFPKVPQPFHDGLTIPHSSTKNTFKWPSIRLNAGKSPDFQVFMEHCKYLCICYMPGTEDSHEQDRKGPRFHRAWRWSRGDRP